MEEVQELITWLQGLILAAAVPRGILCAMKMNTDSDNASRYKLHIKHLIEFVVISVIVLEIIKFVDKYF